MQWSGRELTCGTNFAGGLGAVSLSVQIVPYRARGRAVAPHWAVVTCRALVPCHTVKWAVVGGILGTVVS